MRRTTIVTLFAALSGCIAPLEATNTDKESIGEYEGTRVTVVESIDGSPTEETQSVRLPATVRDNDGTLDVEATELRFVIQQGQVLDIEVDDRLGGWLGATKFGLHVEFMGDDGEAKSINALLPDSDHFWKRIRIDTKVGSVSGAYRAFGTETTVFGETIGAPIPALRQGFLEVRVQAIPLSKWGSLSTPPRGESYQYDPLVHFIDVTSRIPFDSVGVSSSYADGRRSHRVQGRVSAGARARRLALDISFDDIDDNEVVDLGGRYIVSWTIDAREPLFVSVLERTEQGYVLVEQSGELPGSTDEMVYLMEALNTEMTLHATHVNHSLGAHYQNRCLTNWEAESFFGGLAAAFWWGTSLGGGGLGLITVPTVALLVLGAITSISYVVGQAYCSTATIGAHLIEDNGAIRVELRDSME